MKRLLSAVRCDQRLQWRNGFYYASAFVAVLTIVFLTQVNLPNLGLLLPPLVFLNIVTGTFYFVAGLVLLEKGERVLEGLIVTPLRDSEYLLSKIITLVGLALLETTAVIVVVALVKQIPLSYLWVAIGTLLLGTLYVLVGFIFVARYDSVNEYLFPSVLVTIVFGIPLLDYFGLVQSPLFYLHPMQGALLLLRAGFLPVAPWQLVYGAGYTLLWIGIAFVFARRAFYNFVVLQQGARRKRGATA